MMKTTIQEQDGNVVAILEGSLDTAAAAETEKAMDPLNDVEGKDIIIDCTGNAERGVETDLKCFKFGKSIDKKYH